MARPSPAGRLRELVFRTVYSNANAEIQLRAMMIGKIGALNAVERQRAEPRQLQPRPDGAGMGVLDDAIAEGGRAAARGEIAGIRHAIEEARQ